MPYKKLFQENKLCIYGNLYHYHVRAGDSIDSIQRGEPAAIDGIVVTCLVVTWLIVSWPRFPMTELYLVLWLVGLLNHLFDRSGNAFVWLLETYERPAYISSYQGPFSVRGNM